MADKISITTLLPESSSEHISLQVHNHEASLVRYRGTIPGRVVVLRNLSHQLYGH